MKKPFTSISTGLFLCCCAFGQITGVSESSALTPMVHDVDPSLFHNADLDNRAGNVSQGRRRVFVIGKRTAEVALNGTRVSRALQVFTLSDARGIE